MTNLELGVEVVERFEQIAQELYPACSEPVSEYIVYAGHLTPRLLYVIVRPKIALQSIIQHEEPR